MSSSNDNAIDLYCTCIEHGGKRQTLGKMYPLEGIEIKSRHHGTYHMGSIAASELLFILAGTTDGSAVIEFVRRVFQP